MKTIIEMAREAGLHRTQHSLMSNPVKHRFSYDGYEENLERFAALVRADAFEQGRQEGTKQERALRELSKLGQEIEAQPEQEPVAHREAFWCVDLTCKKCYGADFRFKHKSSVDKESLTTPAQPEERNFCPRCGKRTADLTTVHTCTPP